jgi:multicomponent Na+:H+ antiporter subunit C
METVLSILIGILYGMGLYLVLRRSIIKLVFGLVILSQATNLLIFTAAGLTRAELPIINAPAQTLALSAADPLPQALILTAIVISFGILAFALVLLWKAFNVIGNDDLDNMRSTDQ